MSALAHSHMRALAPEIVRYMCAPAPKGSLLSILVLVIEFLESIGKAALVLLVLTDACAPRRLQTEFKSHRNMRQICLVRAHVFGAEMGRTAGSGNATRFIYALKESRPALRRRS